MLAVVVEEEVLVEAEPAQEPLGAVGTALVQVSGVAAVVPKKRVIKENTLVFASSER